MKKTLFLMALAVCNMVSAQKPVKVQGVVEGKPSDLKLNVALTQGATSNFGEEEPLEVKNGKFAFSKEIEGVTRAWIGGGEGQGVMPCTVYLVPGETLKLTIKGDEFFYGGSKIYKECNEADLAITPLQKAYSDYYTHAVQLVRETPQDQQQALAAKLNDTLSTKRQAFMDAVKVYAESHKASEGAMLYLADKYDMEQLYGIMDESVKTGRVGKYVLDRIAYQEKVREEQKKAQEEERAKMESMKGSPAPDFTLKDLDGKDLSLSSLRGKYVVLDFWGSWCVWCIKGVPDMKKYYEKYAGKYEILGIDCNDSDEAWRKAVKEHELPWLHVYNPKTSTVLKDYAIQGFPTKIIVDPEGNIAKIIVGESPDFYNYLDELFGK